LTATTTSKARTPRTRSILILALRGAHRVQQRDSDFEPLRVLDLKDRSIEGHIVPCAVPAIGLPFLAVERGQTGNPCDDIASESVPR
jgi:hypothetical protein